MLLPSRNRMEQRERRGARSPDDTSPGRIDGPGNSGASSTPRARKARKTPGYSAAGNDGREVRTASLPARAPSRSRGPKGSSVRARGESRRARAAPPPPRRRARVRRLVAVREGARGSRRPSASPRGWTAAPAGRPATTARPAGTAATGRRGRRPPCRAKGPRRRRRAPSRPAPARPPGGRARAWRRVGTSGTRETGPPARRAGAAPTRSAAARRGPGPGPPSGPRPCRAPRWPRMAPPSACQRSRYRRPAVS